MRHYALKNSVEGELFPKGENKPPHIATDDEVDALLESA